MVWPPPAPPSFGPRSTKQYHPSLGRRRSLISAIPTSGSLQFLRYHRVDNRAYRPLSKLRRPSGASPSTRATKPVRWVHPCVSSVRYRRRFSASSLSFGAHAWHKRAITPEVLRHAEDPRAAASTATTPPPAPLWV